MPDQPGPESDKKESPHVPPVVQNVNGGIDLHPGGDVNVTGDVAGRDITKVTNVGMQPEAVRRLVITVAAMVFATAACFFTGGIFVGSKVFAAFDRTVNSRQEAAVSMQAKLDALQEIKPGQTDSIKFGEDELSSYVRYVLGDRLGFSPDSGRARFIEPGLIAVGGNLKSLGNLPVIVTFKLQNDPNQQLEVESAAVRLVSVPNSNFGWVAVPTGVVSSVTNQIPTLFRPGYALVSVQAAPAAGDDWTVSVHRQ